MIFVYNVSTGYWNNLLLKENGKEFALTFLDGISICAVGIAHINKITLQNIFYNINIPLAQICFFNACSGLIFQAQLQSKTMKLRGITNKKACIMVANAQTYKIMDLEFEVKYMSRSNDEQQRHIKKVRNIRLNIMLT